MKRWFWAIMAISLLAAACGNTDNPTTGPQSGSTTGSGGGGAGGAGGAGLQACTSIVKKPYDSALPAGDPCKLPGAEAEGAPQSTPPAMNAPLDPLAKGPYPIGVTTLKLQSAGRDILVEVWYPANKSSVGQPTDVYTYPEDAPPGAVDGVEGACLALSPLPSGAARDAVPASGGPFPLVIFSHGTTSTRVQSASVTSHLATHGFVVAAPDHTGDTLLEFFDKKGSQNPLGDPIAALMIAINRVKDVKAIIDHMSQQATTQGSCFLGLVDANNVGVFGHSFGGFTALAASGGMTIGETADPRIKAVLPVAPGGTSYSKASDDPILSMGGDADVTTTFNAETKVAYDRSSAPKHLVKLLGAGHLTVSDMCMLQLDKQIQIFMFAPCGVCDIVANGCPGGTQQMLTTRPAMQYFTAAFFLAYLTQGPRRDRALTLLDPAGPGPSEFPTVWAAANVQ